MVSSSSPSVIYVLTSVLVFQVFLSPATAFHLQIMPRHDHRQLDDRIKILCQADEPITNCEFRSFYKSHYDLNSGNRTTPTQQYRYFGNGMENGECGIDLAPYRRACHDILECRVRTVNHGWKYASAIIEVNDVESVLHMYLVTPHHKYVASGANITVLGHSDVALDRCSYKLMRNDWIHFNQSTHLEIPESDRNLGKGLKNGDCSVIIPNVRDNGFVILLGFGPATMQNTYMSHMTVMTYKAPAEPELTTDNDIYVEGGELRATCTIKDSRPVANISWFLGTELLRKDTRDETTDNTRWRWSYELHNIKQSVRRTLTWEDDRTTLTCRAEHMAIPGGVLNATKILQVQFAPRPVSRPVEVSATIIGEDAVLTCNYIANPPPMIEWKFGESKPGSAVAAGRYNSTKMVLKEANHWIATLTLRNLTLEDHDQVLNATIHNSQGGVTHSIKFNLHPFVDYSFLDHLDEDYDYSSTGSRSIDISHNRPVITSHNLTPSAVLQLLKTSTPTALITNGTNLTTPASTQPTITKANVTDVVVDVKAEISTIKKPSEDTGSNVGLVIAIISLILAVVGIAVFVYRRYNRSWLDRVRYRRSVNVDGAEVRFNIDDDFGHRSENTGMMSNL